VAFIPHLKAGTSLELIFGMMDRSFECCGVVCCMIATSFVLACCVPFNSGSQRKRIAVALLMRKIPGSRLFGWRACLNRRNNTGCWETRAEGHQ